METWRSLATVDEVARATMEISNQKSHPSFSCNESLFAYSSHARSAPSRYAFLTSGVNISFFVIFMTQYALAIPLSSSEITSFTLKKRMRI